MPYHPVPFPIVPSRHHLIPSHRVSVWFFLQTIMNLYAQRTHGTYVVNKGSALLWQFRDADPEFGWLQSKELEDHLTTVLKPFRWILAGNGVDGFVRCDIAQSFYSRSIRSYSRPRAIWWVCNFT